MPRLERWLSDVLGICRAKLDENLLWRLSRQEDVATLRRQQALAEQALVAQLKKQAQRLAHEMAMAQAEHQSELEMVKIRCKQDLRDYQEYLQALDNLKDSLKSSYAHLPDAVAFTVHHHAKQLLNRMWETRNEQERLQSELALIQFLTAIHEDSQLSLLRNDALALPRKTLAIIDGLDGARS
ncbi:MULTISPECIES: hypothetical protein [Methylomonas]|uniref:hypothetical protein n=1 Tax=Methylomonas TaxID=416 RepID=UPI0012319165|nr:hypothetical protein [Methylomonas rhizoryzae]